MIFPKNYPYTNITTKILRENFKELQKEIKEILIFKKNFIVDIGSNDEIYSLISRKTLRF